MLSLFMSETPTQPQPPVPNRATTRRLPRVDEIDTVPPRVSPTRDINQIDTLPPGYGQGRRAVILAPQITPAEIKVLRKLYTTLGLDPEAVYGEIHAVTSARPIDRAPRPLSTAPRIPPQ